MSKLQNFNKKASRSLSKNEKWVSRIFVALLAGTGLFFWDKILPFLIRVVQNTLHLGLLIAAVGALVFVITNPKTRSMAKLAYMKMINVITDSIIKNDPIGVIRITIQQMKSKHTMMEAESNAVAAEKGKIDLLIKNQYNEMQEYAAQAKIAKQRNEMGEYKVAINQVGRLKDSNDNLKDMSDRMYKLQMFLKKLSKNIKYLITDRENMLNSKEKEYAALKAGHKALSNATSIFNGKGYQKEYYDDALRFLNDDMGEKLGQLDRYLEQSQEFITTMDIKNSVLDQKGINVLDNMLEQDFDYLFEDPEEAFDKIAKGEATSSEMLEAPKEDMLSKLNKSKSKEAVPVSIKPIKNTNTQKKNNPYS